MWQLLEQYYITNLDKAKEVFDRFATRVKWSLEQHTIDYEDYDHCYRKLKMCAEFGAKNWLKWITNLRFCSYSKKEKAKKMGCPLHNCRITQAHIMQCEHITQLNVKSTAET